MLKGMFAVKWEGEIKDDSQAPSLDNRREWCGQNQKR